MTTGNNTVPPLDVSRYLEMARQQTIAPLLLEIVLRSGRSYYVKNVFDRWDSRGLFPLRVWDLRALGDDDHQSLVSLLNEKKQHDAWADYRTFLPDLDEANLWVYASDIEHIVEWHDRIWPQKQPSEGGPRRIGFRHPTGD